MSAMRQSDLYATGKPSTAKMTKIERSVRRHVTKLDRINALTDSTKNSSEIFSVPVAQSSMPLSNLMQHTLQT